MPRPEEVVVPTLEEGAGGCHALVEAGAGLEGGHLADELSCTASWLAFPSSAAPGGGVLDLPRIYCSID